MTPPDILRPRTGRETSRNNANQREPTINQNGRPEAVSRRLRRSAVWGASIWGTEGPEFKSRQPDKQIPSLNWLFRSLSSKPLRRLCQIPSSVGRTSSAARLGHSRCTAGSLRSGCAAPLGLGRLQQRLADNGHRHRLRIRRPSTTRTPDRSLPECRSDPYPVPP